VWLVVPRQAVTPAHQRNHCNASGACSAVASTRHLLGVSPHDDMVMITDELREWQVYYWCEATDEVLWEPPAGATPRTDAERDIAAEAAVPGAADASAADASAADDAAASHTEPAAENEGGAEAAETERAGASESLPAAASLNEFSPAEPSQAQQVAEQLSARLRQATSTVFAGASKLVWLAVEAEVRARDLAALGAAHGPGTRRNAALAEQHAVAASSAPLDRL